MNPQATTKQRRTGSLVTPLLLIAIGSLFLLRNVIPDLPLLDYLTTYWPVLLIVWGGLRLMEVVVWSIQSRPLPVRGITGGEWVLVVFVCMVGFALHAAQGFYSWLPESGFQWGGLEVFGQSYEYPVSAEMETSAAPRIVIESFRGNARIRGADVSTVSVTGQSQIRSMEANEAVRANEEARLELIGGNGQVVIRTNQDRARGRERIEADLDIVVPRGASLVARGRGGDFSVNDLDGTVEIDSTRAGVRLENIGGDVRLEINSGDVVRAVNLGGNFELSGSGNDVDLERIAGRVTVDGSYGGVVQFRELAMPLVWDGLQTDIHAEAVPGELRLTLTDLYASGLVGPVRIDSQSKDLWLTQFSDSMDISLNRGDIFLVPGLTGSDVSAASVGRLRVDLNAGNVEVALPEGIPVNVNAHVDSGPVTNSFGDPLRSESFGRGSSILGTTTAPGAGPTTELNVEVGRGQVMIRKASQNESSPQLPGAAQGSPDVSAPAATLPKLPPLDPPQLVQQ